MEDVTVFKLVSMVSIWLVAIVGGMIPVLLARRRTESANVQNALQLLNAFSGGVFLAGGFLHLLHDAVTNEGLQKWGDDFPYAETFCTLGFLSLLLLEQTAHAQMATASSPVTDEYVEARERLLEEQDTDSTSMSSPNVFDAKHAEHHHHSHLSGSSGSLAIALALFLALSFHSVLEGLGIGAQSEAAWGVFLAIIVHKGLAAFALGSEMVQSQMSMARATVFMALFSLMTLIGILVGWSISADGSEDSAASGICVALAAGTFIYVAVMEVIPQEFPRHSHNGNNKRLAQKLLAMYLGYAMFGLLAKWT